MKNKTNINKAKSIKWAVRLFSIIGVIVIYYFIFSVLFDTPIESELKKSTQLMQKHHEKLQKQYDSIQKVIANLASRDTAVYQIIYEAKPFTEISKYDKRKSDLLLKLSRITNKQLGEEFVAKLALIEKVNGQQTQIVNEILGYVLEQSHEINAIPSIQPIDNPKLTLFATSFGRRINPFYKTMQQHDGIDYSVPEGTAVFATADGVISKIHTSGATNGLSVVIDHGNGYKTSYAYLSAAHVKVGQKVSRGDVIALSGNTGLSYAPHLHYEVIKNGKPVEPLAYMFMELTRDEFYQVRSLASHAMQAFD